MIGIGKTTCLGKVLTESSLWGANVHNHHPRPQLREFLRHQQSNATTATSDQDNLLALDELGFALPVVNDILGELVVHCSNDAETKEDFQGLNEAGRRYYGIGTRWKDGLERLGIVEDS